MFEISVFLNIAIILLSIKFYMLRYLIFDDHRYNSVIMIQLIFVVIIATYSIVTRKLTGHLHS